MTVLISQLDSLPRPPATSSLLPPDLDQDVDLAIRRLLRHLRDHPAAPVDPRDPAFLGVVNTPARAPFPGFDGRPALQFAVTVLEPPFFSVVPLTPEEHLQYLDWLRSVNLWRRQRARALRHLRLVQDRRRRRSCR